MARGIQGALLRGFGGRDHLATVLEVSAVAPHCVRITMASPTLFADVDLGPTAWLRFWFPDPAGTDSEFQRAYTIVWADPADGRFAVDVVLHEPAGPACEWASTAQPGMTIPVVSLGSQRFEVPDELPAGFLLIGDSASVPAINSILAVLPDDVDAEVYLERHCADDELIPVADHPRRRIRWVDRTDESSLAAAIEDRDWSNWYAWAGAEAGALKIVRKRLKDAFGFPRSDVHAVAYWTSGRAMGITRDDGGAEQKPMTEHVASAKPTDGSPRGRWRSQGAKELLASVRPQLIVSGFLQAVISLLELAPFVVLIELARQLLSGADQNRVWGTILVFLVLLGVGTVLGAVLILWLHLVDLRFSAAVRRRLLDKLSRVPLGWFTRRGSGSVKKLIQDDTLALHYLVTHAVSDAVAAAVAPVAVLVYLFVVDWRLALVCLVPILVWIMTTWSMVYRSGPKIAEASRWAERMNTEAAAYLDGQPVIRVFGGAAASSFRRTLDDYIGFLDGWQRPFVGKKTFMDLATRPATYLWLIVAAGTVLVVNGAMGPTTLLPFLVLGTTFGARLLGAAYGFGGLREGMDAARRIANTLDEPELNAPADGPTQPGIETPASAGEVSFDNVSFGYRPGVPVVSDVTLTLRPGTVTALVGPSGSGKSTLASLLARFHDVDAGAIRVDGRDIRSMTHDELYGRVGFVFQDVQLVHGTVGDNIALARPSATDAEIHSAAADAQIHERILRLPGGYDTVLAGGVALSGGERQRLTIARALLADTPVLVLDEATAFADPESEYLVQQALGRLIRERTVLVIAHRLHTITDADQIVVLDRGRVAEIGRHDQLLEADGLPAPLGEPHDRRRHRTGGRPAMIANLIRLIPADYRGQLTGYALLTICSVLLRAASALMLVPLLIALFGPAPTTALPWLGALTVAVAGGWLVDWVLAQIGFRIGFALADSTQRTTAERLVATPLSWFTADNTAAARQSIAAGGAELVGLIAYLLTPFVSALLLPLALAAGLFLFSWQLGIAAAITLPMLVGALVASQRTVRAADAADARAHSALTERILEFARTQQALRASRRVTAARSATGEAVSAVRGTTLRLLLFQIPGQLMFSVASQVGLILLAGTIATLTVGGQIGGPEAVALLIVMVRFLEPFAVLAELSSAIESSRGLLSRLRTVVTAPIDAPEGGGVSLSNVGGAHRIEFRGVGFSYHTGEGEQEVLSDLNFILEPGTTTAIVGPSGSGKTTLLYLIAGLHHPDRGQILVDGVDVMTLDPKTRTGLVSMVFQHPYLFDGSVRDNVRVADPDATADAVDDAMSVSRVDEISRRLPGGDSSRVGEAGTALSGGERQRVSIARALLKPSGTLLVDEATSALDTENETAIINAIKADPQARTRVMIAHRRSAIEIADHVLFQEDGQIVEAGSIAELTALGGRFAEFWRQQQRGSSWKITAESAGSQA